MARKIKTSLYLLSGIIAGLLMAFLSASPANAYSYDIENAGKYKFLPSASRFYNRDGGNASLTSTVNGLTYYPDGVYLTTGGVLDYVVLALDTNIPKGSLLSFIVLYHEIGDYKANLMSPIQPHEGFGQFVVMDYEPVSGFSNEFQSSSTEPTAYFPSAVKVTIMTTEPLNAFAFDMSAHFVTGGHANTLGFFPQTYIQLKDSSQVTIDAIDNASDQAHKDSQAELDYQKEQDKKAEEQRKEDEQKAEDNSNNSSDSADSAQSDVDSKSESLFSILTSFVSAITGASPGECSISGDFGFFNAGNINLCSGASKITPVTNIVGSVMLIGLIIPACISLLHRFVDLYNEVMA